MPWVEYWHLFQGNLNFNAISVCIICDTALDKSIQYGLLWKYFPKKYGVLQRVLWSYLPLLKNSFAIQWYITQSIWNFLCGITFWIGGYYFRGWISYETETCKDAQSISNNISGKVTFSMPTCCIYYTLTQDTAVFLENRDTVLILAFT